MSRTKEAMIEAGEFEDDGYPPLGVAFDFDERAYDASKERMEDYSTWSTNDLIDDLDRDEAESVFTEFDPDGPYRYTGELDGWWRALKMMDENEVRKLALEAIAQR